MLGMTPSACIRLRLLGRPIVTRGDDPAPVRLSTRKVTALAAYLAMSPDQAASREELATLLWGSCSDQQARQSLRQALAFLRKDLGSSDLFTADTDVVRLQGSLWSVDALEFEALSKSSDPDDLDRATTLFCGDFLANLSIEEDGFAEWVRAQRARTQLAAARLCETFAARPDLVTDGERAVAAAEQLLALDPLREDWQRLALTLYARYRGKSEALVQYDAFASLLRRELDVAPERETETLVARIRNDEISLPRAIEPATVPLAPPASRLQDQSDSVPAARWSARSLVAPLALVALAVGAAALGLINDPAAPELAAQKPPPPALSQADAWRPPAALQNATTASIIPLAVLPFAALGDSGSTTQLIADMMTDDLINVLSRVPVFRVISRQTTNRYKDQPADLATIGADLQVRYVLEGSVRTQDSILRVNVQLLNAATRLPVWSDRVEREQGERHAVRDEIVARIARELQIDILPIEGERRSADQSADAAAFLGWAAMHAGFTTTNIDEYRKAEALFKQALERDPQNMSAFIGTGTFHTNVAVQRLVPDVSAHFDKARDILTQAVQREPRNPNALYQLGILLQGTRQIREALDLFRKVTELNPSNAGAHAHTGHALARLGEPEKGIEHIRYAMRLSPKDQAHAIWHEFIGNAQLELSRYPDAIESFERSAAIAPRYPRPLAGLAAAYALAGDAAQAQAAIGKLKAAATTIPTDELLQRLGRNPKSRLYGGLSLALAPVPDTWQSPPLPSRRAPSKDVPRGPASAVPRGVIPIAILPFSTEAGDPLLADMITDDLGHTLSRVAALRVISRQTSRTYAANADPAAAGTELGVRYVLRGQVDATAGIGVAVELVDAKSGASVWSQRFQRDGHDRLAIQDEIVNGLGRELSVEVTRAEGRDASASGEVHALIFKGWSAIFDAAVAGLPALTQAETFFVGALAREPQNARALTGLAAYHVLMGVQLFAPDPTPHLAKAESILAPLVATGGATSEAYAYMGLLEIARRRLKDAAQWFERAIEQSPSQAPSHAQLGRILVGQGRAAEGLEHILYAIRLSPRDPSMAYWFGFAGSAQLELGDNAKAIAYLDRAVALHPTQPRTLLVLAAAHAMAGHMSEARRTLTRVQKKLPHLTGDTLIDRFFGGSPSGSPRLREGLRRALAPDADAWQSPPLPSGRDSGADKLTRTITAIAVTPFKTFGEAAGQVSPLSDTMTDDLTNILSRVPELRVISRQSMQIYADQGYDAAKLSAELGVHYVLEGSIRPHGDQLRVNAALIDPANRLTVWTARVERQNGAQHDIQDEIVARIARELHFEIVKADSDRAAADPGVFDLTRLGWKAIFEHAIDGIPALARAEAAFSEVLKRDTRHWSGRVGLGAYHTLIGSLRYVPDWSAHLDKGERLLVESIQERPNEGKPYFFLSMVQRMRGRFDDAVRSLERCIEIMPSEAPCYAHIGHALVQRGRAGEGIVHINYALRLSPRDITHSQWLRFAGDAEIELGHHEQAVGLLRQAYAAGKHDPIMLRSLAAAYALAGNTAEAQRTLAELKATAPHLSPERMANRPPPFDKMQPELVRGLRLALTPKT